jgi:predicted TIM-barrel fold metal-dependent hydrolase
MASEIPQPACDTHMHVFGPPAQYPGAPTRQYSPTLMPYEAYAPLARRLGIERVVLVQPSAYGTDNRCLLDTLRAHPKHLRGVVVIEPGIGDAELDAMHALGVRGVRLNLMSPRVTSVAEAQRLLEPVAARAARLGWHLQIYADPDIVAPIATVLARLPVPVVLDHMAGVRARQGVDHPGFVALLDLLAAGGCWVKLSGADIVTDFAAAYDAAAPFMRALVAANPAQLVWGTDWPHLVHHHGAMGDAAPPAGYRPVDEPALLRLLQECVPEADTLRRILVDNPRALYDFD